MRMLFMLAVFVLTGTTPFDQEKENNHAKWTEVSNGNKYKMEVEEFLKERTKDNLQVSFDIDGDLKLLDKVELTQKGKVLKSLSLTNNSQEVKADPSNYVFKFYHKKMGEKEFEVNFKKGDHKMIKLTLK